LGNFAMWRELHVWASIVTLALVVAKIGLHQGWILATARRYFGRKGVFQRGTILPGGPPASLEHTQPVAVPASTPAQTWKAGRRDFLVLMGTVGAAAVVSTIGVLHDPSVSGAATGEDGDLTSLVVDDVQGVSSQSISSSSITCFARCDRRCSYPGHCKRYQDTNNNGRCDLGECA
jgi:hypothetical protein